MHDKHSTIIIICAFKFIVTTVLIYNSFMTKENKHFIHSFIHSIWDKEKSKKGNPFKKRQFLMPVHICTYRICRRRFLLIL